MLLPSQETINIKDFMRKMRATGSDDVQQSLLLVNSMLEAGSKPTLDSFESFLQQLGDVHSDVNLSQMLVNLVITLDDIPYSSTTAAVQVNKSGN